MKIATLVLFSVMMLAPSPTLFSAPFQKDKPAEVDRAEQSLNTAKGELEKAGAEWGGHRMQAIKHIDAALHELELGEKWARQHHDMRALGCVLESRSSHLRLRGDLRGAIAPLQQSLETYRKIGGVGHQILCCLALREIFLSLGHREEAAVYADQQLEAAEASGEWGG